MITTKGIRSQIVLNQVLRAQAERTRHHVITTILRNLRAQQQVLLLSAAVRLHLPDLTVVTLLRGVPVEAVLQPEVHPAVQAEAIPLPEVPLPVRVVVPLPDQVAVHHQDQAAAHHPDREDAVKLLKNKS